MLDKLKALIPDTYLKILGYLLVAAAIFIANRYFGTDIPQPTPPLFEPDVAFKVGDAHYSFGWEKNDEEVKAIADTLPFRVFGDTPAGQKLGELPDHVYLWKVYEKLPIRGPPIKNQLDVGSCVSFGTNGAVLDSMAVDIVLNKRPYELKDVAEEVTYGGSRVQIGGGRIRGDGSTGAWGAQFVKQYGLAPRESIKTASGKVYDLSTYDTTRCRQWGNAGVPSDLLPIVREHPVQEITQITSWADAKKALAQGYGISVCSSIGFNMRRDARGICQPGPRWDHCMRFDGYHVEAGKEYAHIENSWGANAHTGPLGWGDPPPSGFWVDAAVADRMIKTGGDTWAFSSVKGFPARDSEWFVQAAPPNDVGQCVFVSKSFKKRLDAGDPAVVALYNDVARPAPLTKGTVPCSLFALSP